MPNPQRKPPPGRQWRLRAQALALSTGLAALVACADRVVAPDAEVPDVVTTPVQSLAVSDVVERVSGSLPVGVLTTQLNARIARLRDQMESGRLQGAASSLILAREALRAAREADDGAMAADLTVIELTLDDAGQLLDAASTTGQRARRQ